MESAWQVHGISIVTVRVIAGDAIRHLVESSCLDNERRCVFHVSRGVFRYIRCVKPNPDKQSGRFDGEDVLLQLQYSGTMETIRIRQQVHGIL